VWNSFSDLWAEGFRNLELFVKEHGHCKVPVTHKTANGFNLGSWVCNQRTKRDNLPPEDKDRLDALGFVWDPFSDLWAEGFRNLELFAKEHGHCKAPQNHKTADGFNLGSWVSHQRTKRDNLPPEDKERLDALGFVWDPFSDLWAEGLRNLELFVNEHGHCKVPAIHKTADGFNLGNWVRTRRTKRDNLPPEYKDRLDALGFVWRS
jgi:predicted DNA-binding protein